MIPTILLFLAEHADLLETLYVAITTGKLTALDAKKAITLAMVAASDAAMKAEFPGEK